MPSHYNKPKDLTTQEGFVSDLISTRDTWKNSNQRKHWEKIWEESESRWQLKTKDKDEKWMTNSDTTETNVACEGAVSEVVDMIFGGDSGTYFGTRQVGKQEGSPLLEEYMRVRLDHQIQLKKKALGQYGIRQLVVKGSMPFKVVWKREGGYRIKYQPQLDPMTGQPTDFLAEKEYVENLVDRPEVKFLPVENLIIEPDCTFDEAMKFEIENAVRSEIEKTYSLNIDKLDSTPSPRLSEDEIKDRKDGFSQPDADIRRARETIVLTHVWKWCKVDQIEKVLADKSTQKESVPNIKFDEQAFNGFDGNNPVEAETTPTDTTTTELSTDKQERFYHIVIANDKLLIQAEESEYWVEQDPYGMATFVPVDGEAYGLGIPYLAKSPQDQLKDLRDMSLDNIKLRLYTILKYRPNSSVSKLTLKLKPMGTIPDYTGRDITPLEIPDASQSSLQREASLTFQLQEVTKVNKLTTGNQPAGSDTATTSAILHKQSSKAFKTLVRWIGDNFIVPVCRKVYALDRQLSTPTDIGKLLGGSDTIQIQNMTIQWSQLHPGEVFEPVEFEWIDSIDKVSDQLAAQQMKELFPALIQFPWFNALEATRRIFQRLGEKTDNLIFPPEQMQSMLQPGLLGQQAGTNAPNATTGNSPVPEAFTNPAANGGNANV